MDEQNRYSEGEGEPVRRPMKALGKEELKRMPKKERKAYERQLDEQQKALEKRLVERGAIAARKKPERRSFLWNIIAVSIAFFFGIIAAIGGLVGGGYFALSKFSAKTVLGDNYAAFIKEDYAEKSLLEIGGEFINDLSSGLDSLGKIGKYTPIVETMLESVSEQLETLGIQINIDEFMNVPFSEFGTYMQDEVLLKTELGKALKVNGDSTNLVKAICYGKEGEDYTVDPETREIIPTETGRGATTISSLTSDSSFIGGLAVADILEVGQDSPEFLKAIKDWSIEEMTQSGRIERLKLNQVIGMGDNPSELMKAIGDWRIKELTEQDKMNSLLLSDLLVIDENSPMILKSLKDVTLGDFHTKIDKLRLGDILGKDAIESNKLLRPLKDSSIGTLSSDLQTLTVEQVFGAEIFSYTEINGGVTYNDMYLDYKAHFTEESYNKGVDKRPTAIAAGTKFNTFYLLPGGGTNRLSEGYFTMKAMDGSADVYTLVDENVSIRKETTEKIARYYTDIEYTVTPAFEYKLINYETNGLDSLPSDAVIGTDTDGETGDTFNTLTMTVEDGNGGSSVQTFRIYEDGFGFYYKNGSKRVDLERTAVSYSLTDKDGATVTLTVNADGTVTDPSGAEIKVYERRGTDEYFIKASERIYPLFYFAESGVTEYTEVYERSEVTECYETESGARLDRYLTGVWFLLLTETDGSGNIVYNTAQPVLDMSTLVSDTTARVTQTEMWELYFHHILEENPYVHIAVPITLSDGTIVENLNQLTILQTIELVRGLAGSS